MSPRICFYGDDFTGSADSLINFHRFGLRSALLLSPAAAPDLAAGLDVLGVAGVSRSLPAEEIEAEIRPAFEAFRSLGPTVVQYKVCSTFDSGSRVGSIGRACEIAFDVFGPRPVPVLPAQPELGRWTAFGNHFARATDGRTYRLDRHPTMSVHPSTPMREAELAGHLREQTELPVTELFLPALSRYRELARDFRGLIVLDCVEQAELVPIGRLLWPRKNDAPLFAVGSGGLSYGLGGVLGKEVGAAANLAPVEGVLAVSGSCAEQTAIQIREAGRQGWLCLDVHALGAGNAAARAREALLRGVSAVVYSALGRPDREVTARATGEALAEVVRRGLEGTAVRRLIACGGDSSSWLVRSLGVEALLPLGAVDLAPVVRTLAPDPALDGLEVALKGGQIGSGGLFETLRRGAPIGDRGPASIKRSVEGDGRAG